MRILHLTLKKKWFDMILSGEKKEEYREMKSYWHNRFLHENFEVPDVIRFVNGYGSDRPTMDVECKSIKTDVGVPEWGAAYGELYYVISLGNILNTANIQ